MSVENPLENTPERLPETDKKIEEVKDVSEHKDEINIKDIEKEKAIEEQDLNEIQKVREELDKEYEKNSNSANETIEQTEDADLISKIGEQFLDEEENPDGRFLEQIKHLFTGKTFKYGNNIHEGLLMEKVGKEKYDSVMHYIKERRIERTMEQDPEFGIPLAERKNKVTLWNMVKKSFTKEK